MLNVDPWIDVICFRLSLQKHLAQQGRSASSDYKFHQSELFNIKWRISKSFANVKAKASHDFETAECWIVDDNTGTELWNAGREVWIRECSFPMGKCWCNVCFCRVLRGALKLRYLVLGGAITGGVTLNKVRCVQNALGIMLPWLIEMTLISLF